MDRLPFFFLSPVSDCIMLCVVFIAKSVQETHHVFNVDRLSMAHQRSHCKRLLISFESIRSCGAQIARQNNNKHALHVQYTFQPDLEVNSKQIETSSILFAFHIFNLIILLICLNLFDLSMKSILFSGICRQAWHYLIHNSIERSRALIYLSDFVYRVAKATTKCIHKLHVIKFNCCKCSHLNCNCWLQQFVRIV